MLDLFAQDAAIKDSADAVDFVLKQGAVSFENVTFTYDRVSVLNNLTFEVPAGKTYALVGSSGGKPNF